MDEIETDTYTEIDDTEQFPETEFNNGESDSGHYNNQPALLDSENPEIDSEARSEVQSELLESAAPLTEASAPAVSVPRAEIVRFTRLPMSRIKSIMKMDPDVGLASAEAVFLVTKATELFLETMAKEAYSYTAKSKKKTVSKKDLDTVIETVDALCFLDGAMDF